MCDKITKATKKAGLVREEFAYRHVGRLRFIGIDCKRAGIEGRQVNEAHERLAKIFEPLMEEYAADITDYCMIETRHGQFIDDYYQLLILGKFFKPDTPLPKVDGWEENCLYYYDIPTVNIGYGIYRGGESFGGECFDAYVPTRDQILKDGVEIPFPHAYWTAVQMIDGEPRPGNYRFGYIFGVGEIK